MTKQHFVALADAIRAYNAKAPRPFDYNQITALGDFCQAMNKDFKAARWFRYIEGECGPNGGKVISP